MTEYKKIAIGILIGLLFITLIIVFCVRLVRLYIRKTKEQYKKDQEYHEKELFFQENLKRAIIETQEQVLNNISKDLHDDAGQQLTSVNFQLENLKLDQPKLVKDIEPISKSLAQLSQSIRSISHSLSEHVVLQDNFIKAIESEVKRLKRNKKLNVKFTFEELERKAFSAHERIFIYRIFQECISNCLKHSKCNKIDIVISTKPNFEMTFRDNGVGFDAEQDCGKPSMGLNNMKTRANDINYSLSIKSVREEGTTIILSEN